MKFPLRQKILLGLNIIVWIFTIMMYYLKVIDTELLRRIVVMYPICVLTYLLTQETLVDLNNNRIFTIWFIIGLINFAFALALKKLGFAWGSALRSFLFFLLAYKILNYIIKEEKGRCLLNTFGQVSWKYNLDGQKLTALDVIFNLLLLAVIIVSVFWNF